MGYAFILLEIPGTCIALCPGALHGRRKREAKGIWCHNQISVEQDPTLLNRKRWRAWERSCGVEKTRSCGVEKTGSCGTRVFLHIRYPARALPLGKEQLKI